MAGIIQERLVLAPQQKLLEHQALRGGYLPFWDSAQVAHEDLHHFTRGSIQATQEVVTDIELRAK